MRPRRVPPERVLRCSLRVKSDGEEPTDVVEIDAVDGEEWERDPFTPRATEHNLAELVKKSAASGPVVVTTPSEIASKAATRHATARPASSTMPTPQPMLKALVETTNKQGAAPKKPA